MIPFKTHEKSCEGYAVELGEQNKEWVDGGKLVWDTMNEISRSWTQR